MFRKGDQAWKGKHHTDETRRKMSEAAKRRQEKKADTADNCCQKLIAAIVRQAIKDGAAQFLETETGKGYCALVGVNPVNVMRGRV
jgi:hypothetical protein